MSDFGKLKLQLLLRYVRGEATPGERARVEKWLEEKPERRQVLTELKKIWETPAEEKQDWDTELSWERFQERYGPLKEERAAELHSTAGSSSDLVISQTSKGYSRLRFAYSLAAGFIVILIAVLAVFNNKVEEPVETRLQEVITQKGERTSMKLADGSRVILNANSTLKIPSNYGDTSRTLYLEGEAFFEVEHDDDKPFRVYTGDIYTEDLGTKFNIRTYDPARPMKVVVTEGVVALGRSREKESGIAPTIINPNQMGTVRENGSVLVSEVDDMDMYVGWTKGQLVFKEMSFSEVRQELERWYDIETSLTDSTLNSKRLSATFDNEPLTEVLDVISLSLQMQYSRDKRKVVFEPKQELQLNENYLERQREQ